MVDKSVDKFEKPVYKLVWCNTMYKSSFTTEEAVAVTGITRVMLHYLCRVSVVVPTVSRRQGRRGHGKDRRYSFTDLVSFKVVKNLTSSGVSPVKLRSAIRELHAMGISLYKLPSSHVVIFDKSVYQWDGKGDPFRVVDGQRAFGFVLDIGTIRNELIRNIEKLAA